MFDNFLVVGVLLNLATGIGLAAVYTVLRCRDVKAIQQSRRDWEKSLQDAVGLSEQMYKVLSREIQDLRQEIENLHAPLDFYTASGNLDKRFQVLSLAARGLTLDEISDKVSIPKGEADLILRVNRMKRS